MGLFWGIFNFKEQINNMQIRLRDTQFLKKAYRSIGHVISIVLHHGVVLLTL
jgi:hypothetical protein